tara:strand:+ start:501 stop:674 length:174 start_codon:yes stop_codon:yes gene_type:complete
MIMFDIAEWIANLLVLGIAVVIWAIGVFMIAMIISMINQWIKEVVKGDINENKQRIN